MNDLLGQPIREKRAIKPPKIHLATPYAETVCSRYDVPKTCDLESVTCAQCLSRVYADRNNAARISAARLRDMEIMFSVKAKK